MLIRTQFFVVENVHQKTKLFSGKLSSGGINLRGGMPPLAYAFQAHFFDGWNGTTGNIGKNWFWMIGKNDLHLLCSDLTIRKGLLGLAVFWLMSEVLGGVEQI